jgi:hypothetical protein
MAAVHVMVSAGNRPMPGIMLEIDTEDKTVLSERDGYIHVMWHRIDALEMPVAQERMRMIVGRIAMIGIVGLFGWLAYAETGRRRRGTFAAPRPCHVSARRRPQLAFPDQRSTKAPQQMRVNSIIPALTRQDLRIQRMECFQC